MGAVVKKEVYTTQQPDGTLVTTTTKTTTEEDSYGGGYGYTWTSMNVDYCCTPAAFLRILQIVVGFVIVGCVSALFGPSFRGILWGHTFVLIVTCVCICVTFLLLVIFFLGMHTTFMNEMPWRPIDILYSLLAVLVFLAAGCIEAYYASGNWRRDCNRYIAGNVFYSCPVYVTWAIASACCFLNAILYAIGAFLAWRKHYY